MVHTRKWEALTVVLWASTFKKQSLQTHTDRMKRKKKDEFFPSGETEVEVRRDEAFAFIYGREWRNTNCQFAFSGWSLCPCNYYKLTFSQPCWNRESTQKNKETKWEEERENGQHRGKKAPFKKKFPAPFQRENAGELTQGERSMYAKVGSFTLLWRAKINVETLALSLCPCNY